VVHLSGRLRTGPSIEQPVSRSHLHLQRARVDRRRHLPQERLLCLPGEPRLGQICYTRGGRAELGDAKRGADGHDRVCERERHRLRT
jgi:hypothetical protein